MNNNSFQPSQETAYPPFLRQVSQFNDSIETGFERLMRLAMRVLDVPVAFISLVEGEKIFLKCVIDLIQPSSVHELSLEQSFSQYVLAASEPVVVNDVRTHPLASTHWLFKSFNVIAFAGTSLYSSEGCRLGVFCVADHVPREWNKDHVATIQAFAAATVAEIELRREIIEHKQAAEALRIRFSTVVEHLGEGLLIADLKDTVLYVNAAMSELTGYTSEELVGRTAHEFLVSPTLWPTMQERHQQRMQGVRERYELILKHKNGNQFYTEISATPLRNASGEIIGNLGLITDITERKTLKAQLLQAQKMEVVGQLAGGVAHDFNNLLTIILSSAQLAMHTLNPGTQVHTDLKEIFHAATQAADLTQQLLAFARQQIIAAQAVDLNDLILSMDRVLRRVIGTDVELVTLLGPALKPVRADPSQLEQVIINLAVNARDAMPNGGKLVIKTASVTLDERYTRHHLDVKPGMYVQMMVSDTGVGMDATVIQHLFEPFFTTKEPGKGTGLGLAMAYGIIKQHDGHIDVWSEPGHGSTFTLYLPYLEHTSVMPVAKKATEHLLRGSETILLVEDEPLVRFMSARVLNDQGYTVLEASNGEEALRIARSHPYTPHLLLTDLVMPQMDGMDLAEQLRKLFPNLKVLFTSGYSSNTVLWKAQEVSVDFLPKPFLPSTLTHKVREVLDR